MSSRREKILAKKAAEEAAVEKPSSVLLLTGPHFPFLDFSPDSQVPDLRFTVVGQSVYLSTEKSESAENHMVQTASSVWDCSLVLVKYLEKNVAQIFDPFDRGLRIIELGSGTGLVGIGVGHLLQTRSCHDLDIVVTDVASVVPSLLKNIQLNTFAGAVPVRAAVLDWNNWRQDVAKLKTPFRVVLAADVVWVNSLVIPFVQALYSVCNEDTTVYFSYQSRSYLTDQHLFEQLALYFTWVKIPEEAYHEVFRHVEKITIYILTPLRKE